MPSEGYLLSPTIYDVARLAEVAPATVSRVINEASTVREKTRRRVLDAIEQLHFEPHTAARNLRSRRTGTIGLVVPDIAEPFYGQLAKWVEAAAREQGYCVVLFNTESNLELEGRYLSSLRRASVDGLVFATPEDDTEYLLNLKERGVPVVAMDRGSYDSPVPTVQVDNRRASREAIRHLIHLGRRRIAYINGYYNDRQTFRDRISGYQDALAEASIPFDPSLLWVGNPGSEGLIVWGYDLVRERLGSGVLIDALFSPADSPAIGALRALREAGLRVPEDVAVIGMNDVIQASFTDPPLTAIAQPLDKMAQMAIAMLLQVIAGEMPEPRHVMLDTELRVRGSCGAALVGSRS